MAEHPDAEAGAGAGVPHPGTVERPLYFLHLAKAGGSSLTRLLEDAFPVGSRLPATFADEYLALSEASRQSFPLLCGHFGRLPLDTLDAFPVAITVLRDPAERAWSHYRALRFVLPGTSPSWEQRGVTFAEYLDDPAYGSTATDFQARWLASAPEHDLGGPELPGLALAEPFGPGCAPLDRATLTRRAAATLDQCALVGTTERLPEFVDALGRLLGRWLPPPPGVNVARGSATLDEDAAARVRARSPVDLELHRRANERLDRALELLPSMPAIGQLPIEELPYEQTMADGLAGTGWHARVFTAEVGWHRWTGPSTRSTLHVRERLGGRARLRLRIVASCDREVLDGLEMSVQGRDLAVSRVERGRDVDVLADVELDPAQPVVLELNVPHTRPLSAAASAEDAAAVAVASVRFEQMDGDA